MFVDTFIRRPILASVCSLVLILAGAIAIPTMPVAQYPALAPPQVSVTAFYTGAERPGGRDRRHDAARAGDQRRRGHALHDLVEHQQRRRAASRVTFDVTRDRTSPRSTSRTASTRRSAGCPPKSAPTASPSRSGRPGSCWPPASIPRTSEYDSLFLSNYIDVYVKDALKRVPGVGDVMIFGERKYSMRLWLDPRQARRAARSPPATSSTRCASRTSRSPRAAIGQSPAPDGSEVPDQRPRARAGCASSASSRTSSSRPAPAARSSG